MNITARRSSRSVDVAVSVDPDETDALIETAIVLGYSADGSGGNRMISSEDKRKHALLKRLQDQLGFLGASCRNFLQILGAGITFFFRLGNRDGHIAAIFDNQAESFQSRFQSGNADRRWSHIDTTPRLSEIERHADYTYLAGRHLRRSAVRTGREFFHKEAAELLSS